MGFLTNLTTYFKKPKIVIVTGKAKACAAEAIFQVFKNYNKVEKLYNRTPPFFSALTNKTFVIEVESTNLTKKKWTRLIKHASKPALVATNIGEIPPDSEVFSGSKNRTKPIKKLAKKMPVFGCLILNFDDEAAREIGDPINVNTLTFGFQEKSDLRATDVKINGGTNFKINYKKGNVIPIWQKGIFGKEQIYSALSAAGVGIALGLNFVQVSEGLRNYKSLPGKMRLIEGIKNSKILDDSQSASVFSMIGALEILGKISNQPGKKISVLGDILGVGKYTVEAHESIGERVVGNSDLLFTVGSRAKFIAKGATIKGMPEDKIKTFDTIESVIAKLKKEIGENDLVLVDGSKEMEMGKVVKEISSE